MTMLDFMQSIFSNVSGYVGVGQRQNKGNVPDHQMSEEQHHHVVLLCLTEQCGNY